MRSFCSDTLRNFQARFDQSTEAYKNIKGLILSKIFLILILAAGLSACASTAADAIAESDGAVTATAESDQVTTAAAETKKPKKRCYREKDTGSRLGVRTCETVLE